ncbi:MAG: hypothetical protein WC367_01880 [Methanoregula sp.]|jgi:hypothetical protein
MNFRNLFFRPTTFFEEIKSGWKEPVAFFLLTIIGYQLAVMLINMVEASLFGPLGFHFTLTLSSFLYTLAYYFVIFVVIGLGVCLLLYFFIRTRDMGAAWKVLMYAQFPALFFLICMGFLNLVFLITVPAPPMGSSYAVASSYSFKSVIVQLITYGLMLIGLVWAGIIAIRGIAASYKIPVIKASIVLLVPLLVGLAIFEFKLCTSVINSVTSIISTSIFHPDLL